jgi:hypothetical protein
MQEIEYLNRQSTRLSSAHVFALVFVTGCAVAAAAIGAFPLEMSIATVFAFAGVHNLLEFRYFVGRVPVRWGRSRVYYTAGIGGVVVLTGSYLCLYFSGGWLWNPDAWVVLTASWNTAFILWLGLMVYLRGRQRPRSDWSWAFPAAFLLIAAAWAVPQYWSLSLVYLHPLVAMWFLERQIRRTKPEWLRAYHVCLASVPVFVVLIWLLLYGTPDLSNDTKLFWRITQHAGGEILPGISSRLLVATHVFLESIHYFVWILLIPLVDRRSMPWRISEIPLLSSRNGFPKLLLAAFTVGIIVVLLLWAGFAVDYTRTRDIYFAFAMAHVLAEFPFLIKML